MGWRVLAWDGRHKHGMEGTSMGWRAGAWVGGHEQWMESTGMGLRARAWDGEPAFTSDKISQLTLNPLVIIKIDS